MSIDVNIHVWLEQSVHDDSFKELEGVLECIAIPQHTDNDESMPTRFERVKVYDTSFSRMVLDKAIVTNDVSEVWPRLEPHVGPEFHYEFNSVFDCLVFDDRSRKLQPEIRPLTINFYGPEHGWQGLEYKSYGSVRLDFSNTKVFQVSQKLIEHVKDTTQSGGDTAEGLKMIARLARNFDAVSGLATRIIKKINPTHLLVCSDLEVHPLTAHAIYHRNWQDYLEDLQRIARLHEHGGVYFCDVTPDDPAFRNPRKLPPNYGYLRGQYGDRTEEDLVEKLQPIVNAVMQNPERPRLSKDYVEECFFSLGFTEVEKMNDSYYLSVMDAPFAYLEEPYFRLYEAAYNSSPSSTLSVS